MFSFTGKTPEDVLNDLLHPGPLDVTEAREILADVDDAAAAGNKATTRLMIENGMLARQNARDYEFFDEDEKNAVRVFILAVAKTLAEKPGYGA